MIKKSPLGRGLSALITDANYEVKTVEEAISSGAFAEIEIDTIEANPYQPRVNFDNELLNELTESIKQLGVIQPITVRRKEDNKFQLISGERRLRASKIAGITTIPAFVRAANDQEMLELALVENIQREDLNPVEIAISYKRLMEECNLTQDALATRTGKARSSVANYLGMLNLPPEILSGIRETKISMGHAKILNGIKEKQEQLNTYYKILAGGLSVRAVEELANTINKKPDKKTRTKNELPDNYNYFKTSLTKKLNTKVELIHQASGKGKIVINFKSEEEFEKLNTFFTEILKNDIYNTP